MSTRSMVIGLLAAAALLPHGIAAQVDSTRAPAVGPAIQRITTGSAVSTESFGAIQGVRELRDGRILVNDGQRRRLLLLDTALNTVKVVLDSISAASNAYGTRAGALVPFTADTTLFVDPASYAMLVLDPGANLVRVRSVWRADDLSSLAYRAYGAPRADARGRVVVRRRAQPAPPAVAPPAGVPWIPQEPDSAFVVAIDLATRKADTLGVVRVPTYVMSPRRLPDGNYTFDIVVNPLPLTDEWVVLSDGTVAIVRGRDYRVDFLDPSGSWRSSPKIPFEWHRLDDAAKEQLTSTYRAQVQKFYDQDYVHSMIRWVNQYGRDYPRNFRIPEGFVPRPGIPRDWILPTDLKLPADYQYACPPGVTPPVPTAPAAATTTTSPAGASPAQPACVPAPPVFVSSMMGVMPMPSPRMALVAAPAELPDYFPPFSQTAVWADEDGNLWVRTNPPVTNFAALTAQTAPPQVYDIIDRNGQLVNRIQLPPTYTLVGFGPGKVVYLSKREPTGTKLARVRLR